MVLVESITKQTDSFSELISPCALVPLFSIEKGEGVAPPNSSPVPVSFISITSPSFLSMEPVEMETVEVLQCSLPAKYNEPVDVTIEVSQNRVTFFQHEYQSCWNKLADNHEENNSGRRKARTESACRDKYLAQRVWFLD